jgi:outer membrane protein TolC
MKIGLLFLSLLFSLSTAEPATDSLMSLPGIDSAKFVTTIPESDSSDTIIVNDTVTKNDSILQQSDIKDSIALVIPNQRDSSFPLQASDTSDNYTCLHFYKESDADTVPAIILSLQEVIDEAIKSNPAMLSARLEWKASNRLIQASKGAFEPDLTGKYKYSILEKDYSRFAESNNNCNVGVEGKTPVGTIYNIGFSISDIRYSRNSLDKPNAFTGISITQPLLKGSWFGAPMADLKVIKINTRIAFNNYRSRAMQILFDVEEAYWNLSFTQEKLRFSTESVNIAQKIVDDCLVRVKTGKMAKTELIEAEAGLATRLASNSDVRQEFLNAVNRLKVILSSDKYSTSVLLSTSDSLYISNGSGMNFIPEDSSHQAHYQFQPEYLNSTCELEKAHLTLDVIRNSTLPELNAKGSYGYIGTGSTTQFALNKLGTKPLISWSSEIELRIPILGSIEERNQLAAAKMKIQIARKNLESLDYELTSTLGVLTERLSSVFERVNTANEAVKLRMHLLDVELIRLKAGKSNSRLIFEIEEKLTEAKLLNLESHTRYRISAVLLAKIRGTLLIDKKLETIIDGNPVLAEDLLQTDG